MALRIGKKKDDAAATSATPAADAPAAGSDDFDLSSFADDLETTDPSKGAVSFDDPTPQSGGFGAGDYGDDQTMIIGGGAPPPGPASASAFDWSEESLLGDLGNDAPQSAPAPAAPTSFDPIAFEPPVETTPFDGDFGLANVPTATATPAADLPQRRTRDSKPSDPTTPDLTPAALPISPGAKPKKSKLVPILGLVALLAVGGGGYYFLNSKTVSDDDLGTPAPNLPRKHKPKPAVEKPVSAPPQPAAPVAASPQPATPVKSPAKPAPPVRVAANPAANPATKPPVAPAKPKEMSPDMQDRLKKLWVQGADIKHQADAAAKEGKAADAKSGYEMTRNLWKQILILDPPHKGIQEAIDKLPK